LVFFFFFGLFKTVFENRNRKPFSVVFSLKMCLTNYFRKQKIVGKTL